ncbi:hypothetical protein MTBUT4_400032 [Magnetospirillum sp. UT-4]|nr:hypothetical protein MTBUT4_400032 [Magnetospirillum sp. UT-4]
MADKGYDGDSARDSPLIHGILPVIPPGPSLEQILWWLSYTSQSTVCKEYMLRSNFRGRPFHPEWFRWARCGEVKRFVGLAACFARDFLKVVVCHG